MSDQIVKADKSAVLENSDFKISLLDKKLSSVEHRIVKL